LVITSRHFGRLQTLVSRYLLGFIGGADHVETLRLDDDVAGRAGHHAAACTLNVLAQCSSSNALCVLRDVAQGHAFESFAFKLVPSMWHLDHARGLKLLVAG
jgi:hypothetical protein